MRKITRRFFTRIGLTAGITGGLSSIVRAGYLSTLSPTPLEIEGPFYPVTAQKDKDFDLTKIAGKTGVAKGQAIIIEGRVLQTNGDPIEAATVELWQANAAGRYSHPRDPNPAPLDPNFQGWAVVPSGQSGGFRFKTIFPGPYPAAQDWMRPPHLHFKVSKGGYVELITQMYFPGHELNETDRLLQRKGVAEQLLMIATAVPNKPNTYRYTIVLQTT